MTLALMALQLVPYEINDWGLYGRSLPESITGLVLGLLPLLLAAAELVRRRRRRDTWLRALRATFWVMLTVAVIPAYLGAMSTII